MVIPHYDLRHAPVPSGSPRFWGGAQKKCKTCPDSPDQDTGDLRPASRVDAHCCLANAGYAKRHNLQRAGRIPHDLSERQETCRIETIGGEAAVLDIVILIHCKSHCSAAERKCARRSTRVKLTPYAPSSLKPQSPNESRRSCAAPPRKSNAAASVLATSFPTGG